MRPLAPSLLLLLFGARTLRRNPGFTAVAVLTLGLGIGANTAIFSVFNAVLLRPLPFPRSGDLVLVWATNVETDNTEDVTSYPNFEDWQERSRSFERMAAFTTRGMTLSGSERTERVEAVQATPGFFETLGVSPALGRSFRPGEGDEGPPKVAVLSAGAWKRSFGGRADALGRTIRVNEETYTIVGVMPPASGSPPGRRSSSTYRWCAIPAATTVSCGCWAACGRASASGPPRRRWTSSRPLSRGSTRTPTRASEPGSCRSCTP